MPVPVPKVDWKGLYAIVDPACCGGREPMEVAEAILRGGCAVLQLRVKMPMDDRALVDLGGRLRRACAGAGVPFVVNDRADLAVVLDADGLHLGQDDLTVPQARRVVGELPIGVSTHDPAQAARAEAEGADLIGFGPVFETGTKQDPDPVVGLSGLAEVCRSVQIPVVAIGGIDVERAAKAARAGASLVAAISALGMAADPQAAAAAMQHAAVASHGEAEAGR